MSRESTIEGLTHINRVKNTEHSRSDLQTTAAHVHYMTCQMYTGLQTQVF